MGLTLLIALASVPQQTPRLKLPVETISRVDLSSWKGIYDQSKINVMGNSFEYFKSSVSSDGKYLVTKLGRQQLDTNLARKSFYWTATIGGVNTGIVGSFDPFAKYDCPMPWDSMTDSDWDQMGFRPDPIYHDDIFDREKYVTGRLAPRPGIPNSRVWSTDGNVVMFWLTGYHAWEKYGLARFDFQKRVKHNVFFDPGPSFIQGTSEPQQDFTDGVPGGTLEQWLLISNDRTLWKFVDIKNGIEWTSRNAASRSAVLAIDFKRRRVYVPDAPKTKERGGVFKITEYSLPLDPEAPIGEKNTPLGDLKGSIDFIGLLPSGKLIVEDIVREDGDASKPEKTNLYLSDVARTKFEIVGHERIIATSIDNRWLIVGAPKWDGPHWLVRLKD